MKEFIARAKSYSDWKIFINVRNENLLNEALCRPWHNNLVNNRTIK